MEVNFNTPRYWQIYYEVQGSLATHLIHMYGETVTGGIRTQSSLPEALNQDAESIALKMYAREMKLQTPKLPEHVVLEVSHASYMVHLGALDNGLRMMLHSVIKADSYYVVFENDDIIGGFTTMASGYMQGLFGLVVGKGKLLLKLQLDQFDKDVGTHIRLYTYCFDSPMVELLKAEGFDITHIDNWDERLAPTLWDGVKYGMPNVVHFSRDTA